MPDHRAGGDPIEAGYMTPTDLDPRLRGDHDKVTYSAAN